jgi:hypothetical protein
MQSIEAVYGVGRTPSAFRVSEGDEIDPNVFDNALTTILCQAGCLYPRVGTYTGMNVSTRESQQCR